jgi:CheY-like chemotaxis protein
MSELCRKILIIEDDPDIMRLLNRTLSGAGYHVIHACGGEEALRKIEHTVPDLVLTDLAMPQMSGVEVIQILKGNPDTAHIPVVAITAHMWDGIAQSAGQVGADGFINKPFASKTLLQEVAALLSATPRGAAARSS